MKDEYISRQAAIDAINRLDIPEDMCVFEILSHIELELGTLPSAQPERIRESLTCMELHIARCVITNYIQTIQISARTAEQRWRWGRMLIEKTETFVENDIWVDGIKIGTVELCPERNEIARLIIFEPYQNKGYGTKVVKELVSQGYKSLWVRSDNSRAIHVYEKCGFKRAETHMFEMKADKAERRTDG